MSHFKSINLPIIPLVFFLLLQVSPLLAQHTMEQTEPETTQVQQQHGEATHGAEHGSSLGTELPIWSVIPFIGILLSIAIFPLVAPRFWHHHFGKVSAFWALLLAIPFLLVYRGEAFYEILHIYLADYIPFIILLWALFTAAGGILVQGAPG